MSRFGHAQDGGPGGQRVLRRHRFEPARLVLGLCLLPIAALFILHATGETELPVGARFTMLPAALLLAAVVAVIAMTVRRTGSRGPAGPPGDEGAGGPGEGAS
ncbi:hypothetical protein RM844_02890 [Streptomyces sp. DSM 44915]|uniref:Integral membrane protein n=1 Tax=Streptomyces chisholmiae TaxID=3075540 RepID=A0ABU2JJR8_9ACTN|nr:hypothetical protein [Streptomyces sp. DSM 44915]MDT0265232.1 hypothetical protein [Streptomyces sp. DSM 44915]